jgi:hypothetical protein
LSQPGGAVCSSPVTPPTNSRPTGLTAPGWKAGEGALERGESFLDVVTGSLVLVMHWEERPWIVILSKDGDRVVTTYPSDERTVTNRRGAGRWMYPAN